MKLILKPAESEFQANEPLYMKMIPDDGLLLQYLDQNYKASKQFILSLSEEKWTYRYAAGKWNIKEIAMHLIDMERVYMYRSLCIARNDKTSLPGFDHEKYILNSGANERAITEILEEYEAVRKSTIRFLEGLTDEALARSGLANGNPVSVRALAYHIAGHELHHIEIIRSLYL